MTIELEEFPSKEGITASIKEHSPAAEDITILSLFEFRTKEDYDNFNR
jgi:hypothetical protein